MNNQGILLVVSGASGTGKGTVCAALLRKYPNIHYSVSITTRKPRPGEANGLDYLFVSKEEFEELRANDQLLEHAKVYDNYYGTPRKNILEKLNQGTDVLLEIEMDGAEQVRNKFRDGVFVFILPPSLDDLSIRLKKRAKDSEEMIQRRLESATSEIARAARYDYVVVNNLVDEAVDALALILEAERHRVSRNLKVIDSIRYGSESVR